MQEFIKIIPGKLKRADGSQTNLLEILGVDTAPLEARNDGYKKPEIAAVLIGENQYALADILETVADQINTTKGAELSPTQIQRIVANGDAKKHFAPGDILYIPYTDYSGSTPVLYRYPFVVVHIGDCYDNQDKLHKDALWLMAMYATPLDMIFDAPEITAATPGETFQTGAYYYTKSGDDYVAATVTPGDTIPESPTYYVNDKTGAGGAIRYGYNRWSQSAYRQWLNSDKPKNANWWTSQHEYDVAPASTYTNKPGWVYGFDEDWKAIFKPVKVQTSCNTVTDSGVTDTTYDKFFLPSLEQMYGLPQAAGVEGDYWEYWKDETGLENPSNGSGDAPNDARKIPAIQDPGGAAVYCRLRSAVRGTSYIAWYVTTAGYLSYNFASYSYRSQPACVIY